MKKLSKKELKLQAEAAEAKRLEEEQRTAKRLEEIQVKQRQQSAERALATTIVNLESQRDSFIKKYASLKAANNKAVNDTMIRTIAHFVERITTLKMFSINSESLRATSEADAACLTLMKSMNDLYGKQTNAVSVQEILTMQDNLTRTQNSLAEAMQVASDAMGVINPASNVVVDESVRNQIEMLVSAELEKSGTMVDIPALEQEIADAMARNKK